VFSRPRGIGRAAGGVWHALVELAAIGGIGEPVAAVGVGDDVVGRVEGHALEFVGQDGDRAVELVAHDAAGEVFAADLAAFVIEGVAVGIVRRHPEGRDVAVLREIAQLAVVGDVGEDEELADAVPRRPLGPERAGPEPLDRRVGLGEAVEGGIDGDNVGVPEIDVGGCVGPELAPGRRDRGERLDRAIGLRAGGGGEGEPRGAGSECGQGLAAREGGWWYVLHR
jgi:hypothetical protein